MAIFEVHSLDVEYRRPGRTPLRAVVGASLAVERGELVGLVGETGCGKSSLARAAVGLVAPAAGSVLLEGVPIRALSRSRRPERERKVQMVFQNPFSSLNPRRKIGDQIADGFREL